MSASTASTPKPRLQLNFYSGEGSPAYNNTHALFKDNTYTSQLQPKKYVFNASQLATDIVKFYSNEHCEEILVRFYVSQ